MSAGPFQEPHPQSLCCIAMRCAVSYRAAYFSCKICVIVWTWIRMPAMEQAVQENRSITKRESTIRLFAAIFLAALLLFLLGFRSVGFKTAQVIFFWVWRWRGLRSSHSFDWHVFAYLFKFWHFLVEQYCSGPQVSRVKIVHFSETWGNGQQNRHYRR